MHKFRISYPNSPDASALQRTSVKFGEGHVSSNSRVCDSVCVCVCVLRSTAQNPSPDLRLTSEEPLARGDSRVRERLLFGSGK